MARHTTFKVDQHLTLPDGKTHRVASTFWQGKGYRTACEPEDDKWAGAVATKDPITCKGCAP